MVEPYASIKQRNSCIPKVEKHMRAELKRRFKVEGLTGKQAKCNSFGALQCRERLKQLAIKDPRDIAFIRKEEGEFYRLILRAKRQREEDARNRLAEANWIGNNPYLRLYHCICHERARQALIDSRRVMDRAQLDAGAAHEDSPATFEETVAALYNDASLVFHTERLPDLHDDFREVIVLRFEDMPGGTISADEVKARYGDSRAKLIKVGCSTCPSAQDIFFSPD